MTAGDSESEPQVRRVSWGQRLAEAIIVLAFAAWAGFFAVWDIRTPEGQEPLFWAGGMFLIWVLCLAGCLVARRGYRVRGEAGAAWLCSVVPWCVLPAFVLAPVAALLARSNLAAHVVAPFTMLALAEALRRVNMTGKFDRTVARGLAVIAYLVFLSHVALVAIKVAHLGR